MVKKFLLGLPIVLLSIGGDAIARDDCYAWSQARTIIAKEKLFPSSHVTDKVVRTYGGKLIRSKLCERGGRFVYDVTVLGDGGQVMEVTVDGRSGREISAKGARDASKPKLKKGNSGGFGLLKFWK